MAAFLTLLAERGFAPDGKDRAPRPLGHATIGRRLAAIVFAHRAAGLEPPTSQPDVARVSEDARGLLIRISAFKTDQEGFGHTFAIPDGQRLEPVRHYRAWLAKMGSPTARCSAGSPRKAASPRER